MPHNICSNARKQQIVCILGVSCVLPSIYNQMLYPLSFAFHKEGVPSLLTHYLLYSLALLVCTLAVGIIHKRLPQSLLKNKTAIAALGVVGSVGVGFIVFFDFSTTFSSAMVAIGIVLAAVYVPTHYIFWNTRIIQASEKRVTFDLAVSYAVFCTVAGVRIAFGIHSWMFAIAYPIASAVLAWYSLSLPSKEYASHPTSIKDFPLVQLGIGALFVYGATIIAWIADPEIALSDYPLPHRALMYTAVGLFACAMAVLYRPKSKLRTKANAIMSVSSAIFLAACILTIGIESQTGYSFENYPVLAGKLVLEMSLWLILLSHAQRLHLGIIHLSILYLIAVVGGSRLLSALLMFASEGFSIPRSELPTLGISIGVAFAMMVAANIIMVVILTSKSGKGISSNNAEFEEATSVFNLDAATQAISDTFGLSQRESDTLRLALANMSARAMAEELFIAESTVNTHLKSIYRKTDVHSKSELIALAKRFDGQRD